MCNTNPAQMDQAMRWMFEDLWSMIDPSAYLFSIEWALSDLVHMQNMLAGKDGYSPEIIDVTAIQIGL